MFQNVHDELATTKSELEGKKIEMTDMTEKNLRLANYDSRLRRKIEDRDRLIASSRAELENLRVCLAEQQLNTRELAVNTRELESKNKTISELEAKNVTLDENDSQLRRIEEPSTPVIEIPEIETACLASSRANENNLFVLDKERLENELSLLQSQLTDSSSKLQQYQNVQDELATTKNELEEKKREITDITGENFHLTKENSGLMRKIEARDRLIAYKRTKLQELNNCYEEKKIA
jgi:chromosome segregation ATPase